MTDDLDPKLDIVLAELQSRFGDRIIAPAKQTETVRLPTGNTALDAQLAGGMVLRKLTQITGSLTSGVTSLVFQTVARTQADDRHVVYVDLAGHFDSDTAKRRNVDLPQLLLVRSVEAQKAMTLVNRLLAHGASSLIVLDASRVMLNTLPADARRLRQALATSSCGLLVIGQTIPADLTAIAETRIHLDLIDLLRRDRQIIGLRSCATVGDARGERKVPLETFYGLMSS